MRNTFRPTDDHNTHVERVPVELVYQTHTIKKRRDSILVQSGVTLGI